MGLMSIFEHRHFWRPVTHLTTVSDPQTGQAKAALFVEECSCGAIRSIEFKPGAAPVVREAEHGGV